MVGDPDSGGSPGQRFNVLIDARPVDGEASSCLGASNSLVSVVKAAEHCGAKACRN